jgi:hypothetical protein
MATAARSCEFCSKIIDDKSYRSLTSNTSQENYKEVFELLCLSELKGFCCHLCINKLNAISRLNKDMKTKLITTKRKLDQIVSTVQNLPGVKKYMSSVGVSLINQIKLRQVSTVRDIDRLVCNVQRAILQL